MFVIIILFVIFVAVLFYTVFLYGVKTFLEFIRYCIEWKFLRILLYIFTAICVIVPHYLVLSLLFLIFF